MSTRTRRTLVSEVRRSPRIKSTDLKEKVISLEDDSPPARKRIPTPPRLSKAKKLMVPSELSIPSIQGKLWLAPTINSILTSTKFFEFFIILCTLLSDHVNRSAQVTTEFSDDDFSATEEETNIQSGLFNPFHGLWTSFKNAEDKGRKQSEEQACKSWNKRNLFAIFVLVPLIVGILAFLLWSINNGVQISLAPMQTLVQWPFQVFMGFLSSKTVMIDKQSLDVDLLIEKILSHDKFNEIVNTDSASASDKVMYFAKAKLDAMEKEFKAANDELLKSMEEKLVSAQGHVTEIQQVDEKNLKEIRDEFEKLKSRFSQNDENEEELKALRLKIDDLLYKHDDLTEKLANCQKNIPSKEKLEEELISALKQGLITKAEFISVIDETQQKIRFGLETQVLEKVRNDPHILDKMARLASHQNGKSISNDEVVNIVHEALTVYDADKTGLFDFALESAGGTIASVRCTETYDVTQVSFARLINVMFAFLHSP